MASTWRNFKNIFSIPLFTIIYRPKIVILGTDSILRVKKTYELAKYDVFSEFCCHVHFFEVKSLKNSYNISFTVKCSWHQKTKLQILQFTNSRI